MVSWRESVPSSEAAVALLTEYFDERRESFPAVSGGYVTRFPVDRDFEPPRGVFLIVEGDNLEGDASDIGCGGIRLLETESADSAVVRFELKHLFIQPHARGRGHGRLLLKELERRASGFGATELVLDTNDSLEAAGGLYRSSGFEPIEPYNANSNATTWYRKTLA
jgi:GNAT superfamily N-acetyltransferase